MSNTGVAEGRLELHIEATGRGRRMVARLADGTVLASGRHYAHLLENIRKAAAARYTDPVKLALLVGRRRAPLVAAGSVGVPAGLEAEDPAAIR
jgi:hypothetical protein